MLTLILRLILAMRFDLMNLADDDEEIEKQRREEYEAENNLNGEESTDLIEDTNNNAFCS